ncbi:MAG TPA: hypothetical protein VGP72_32910 [Planctomycetota bacterium]
MKKIAKNVLHSGSRVWVEGVPDTCVGTEWDMGLRALAAGIEYLTQRPVDFDEMLVLSGDACAAMASDVYQDRSYLAASINVMSEGAKAYGFDGKWEFPESFDAARQIVASEINAGRPVPAGGAAQPYGCCPWGLITGYDTQRAWFCFAGYDPGGGTRWMDVRGDCGEQTTGPWNGCVRGLLGQEDGFWKERPLFTLGVRRRAATRGHQTAAIRAARMHALKLAAQALAPASHRINECGGVTYLMGMTAVDFLATTMRDFEYSVLKDMQSPQDAQGWWKVPEVLRASTNLIMRGRRAAARVFRRWARDSRTFKPLLDIVPRLEDAAECAEVLWTDLMPPLTQAGQPAPQEPAPRPIEQPGWGSNAAEQFRRIMEADRECLRVLENFVQ